MAVPNHSACKIDPAQGLALGCGLLWSGEWRAATDDDEHKVHAIAL